MSVQTVTRGFSKVGESVSKGVHISSKTIAFCVVGLVLAGVGGKFLGMGKTFSLAIIAIGFVWLLRDAGRKHIIAAFALALVALAYMFGSFIMTNTGGASDMLGSFAGSALLGILLFITIVLLIASNKGITESFQLFAFLFLFDGAFFGQFWITELVFGKWLPALTHFVVSVFQP